MDTEKTLKWAGVYLGLWLIASIVAIGVITLGVALGGLAMIGAYEMTPMSLRLWRYPRVGAGVILIGLILWHYGSAVALFKTLTSAIEQQTVDRLNTEAIKSDILSVLDDRLADIHTEASETRRLVERMGREEAADEFEFQEQFGD